MPGSLTDLAVRRQVYLERLKAGYDGEWNPIQAVLREEIGVLFGRRNVTQLRELSNVEFNRLLVDIDKAWKKRIDPFMRRFLREMRDLAGFSVQSELVGMRQLGQELKAVDPTRAFAAALVNPVMAVGERLEDLVRNFSSSDSFRLNKVVRQGWASGSTLSAMTRTLVGTKTANYKDGQLDATRRNASTVLHTAAQHLSNTARAQVWESNSDIVKGYKWVATLDRRTTTICRTLDELDKVYKTGEGPIPPAHPNCRSTTRPWLGKRIDRLFEEDATRTSATGPVDASLKYYGWLQTQSKSFQEDALGPARAKLFRSGGLTAKRFAELQLDRNFQPMTLAQMSKVEPEAFSMAFGENTLKSGLFS